MNLIYIDDKLKKINKKLLLTINIIFCIILGWIEWLLNNECSLSAFYIISVLITSWYIGKKSSIFISFFAVFIWLIGDIMSNKTYSSYLIPYINVLTRTALFLSFSTFILIVRKHLTSETKFANEDFLTKISNSRAFFNYAKMEIERLKRYKSPFTLIYFDVDNFKTINDTYGHNTGDMLLAHLAYTIRKKIRPTDVVARLGGDEFVILLIETNPDNARLITEKLQQIMKSCSIEKKISLTFSFGVVTFLKPPASVDDMIKKADDLMFLVKRKGKNAINYFVFE